jgi:hypothetical protein
VADRAAVVLLHALNLLHELDLELI